MSIKHPVTFAEEGGVTRLYDGHFALLATFNNFDDARRTAAALNATELFTHESLLMGAPSALCYAASAAYNYLMDVAGNSRIDAEQLLHAAKEKGGLL